MSPPVTDLAALPAKTVAEPIQKLVDQTPVLNSSNSFISLDDEAVVDDFPYPLSDFALYGLGGDIVRRIEAHTEADSAALLVQVLVAFGNCAGRTPHAMADGSRHGMNLFCVLVGESSKSRKGTALAHIKRIIAWADEDWSRECLTSGLTSGEGLIYAVRDPVIKPVRQRNGSYEDKIVDQGVTTSGARLLRASCPARCE